jgi:hypothetical protein
MVRVREVTLILPPDPTRDGQSQAGVPAHGIAGIAVRGGPATVNRSADQTPAATRLTVVHWSTAP